MEQTDDPETHAADRRPTGSTTGAHTNDGSATGKSPTPCAHKHTPLGLNTCDSLPVTPASQLLLSTTLFVCVCVCEGFEAAEPVSGV